MPPINSAHWYEISMLQQEMELRRERIRRERMIQSELSELEYQRIYEQAVEHLRQSSEINFANLDVSQFRNDIDEPIHTELNTNEQIKPIVMNNDIRTQLLSRTLHEYLDTFAINGNKIAKSLIKLNNHGYFQDSTRNVTIDVDKEMTYCPAGKPTYLGMSFNWVVKGRQSGKYGKVIRKILNEQIPNLKFSDSELEELVNKLKSKVDDGRFRIVSGEDIRRWYHGERYNEDVDTGSLSGSCMRYDSCQSYFDIYVKNPDKVQMLILTDYNDRLVGRALIWEEQWMDRIYASDSITEKFIDYAERHGYNRKEYQCYDEEERWVAPDGIHFIKSLSIYLNTDHSQFPYMDTFKYMNDGVLSNFSEVGCLVLNETDGSAGDNEEGTWDEIDDCYIDEDDAVWIDGRDITTHVDNCVRECRSSEWILRDDSVEDRHGNVYHNEDVIWCDGTEEYVSDSEDVSECAYDGKTYPDDKMTYIEYFDVSVADTNLDDYYCKNDFYEVNGEWQHADELFSQGYKIDVENGEWVMADSDEVITETPNDTLPWSPSVGDTVRVLRAPSSSEEREWECSWESIMDRMIGHEVTILEINNLGLRVEGVTVPTAGSWYVPRCVVEQIILNRVETT